MDNIICVLPSEKEFFLNFCKENGVYWPSEQQNNNIITISRSYVGYIITPIRRIDLQSKYKEINFSHIFRMYLFVHNYSISDNVSTLGIDTLEKSLDISKIFVDSLNKSVRQGIYRDYKSHVQKSKYFKGQVDYITTYRNYCARNSDYVVSNSDKLTLDNDINRLLKSALKKINKTNYKSDLLNYFMEVKDLNKSGHETLESIAFNSRNEYYRKSLVYAAMIVDNLGASNSGRKHLGTESFIINFDKLFEEFVYKAIVMYSKDKLYSKLNSPNELGYYRSQNTNTIIKYNPDIVYGYTDEDPSFYYNPSASAVIDVKNKAYSIFKNSDIYQILTYSKLLNSSKSILVYPSFRDMQSEKLNLDEYIFSNNLIYAVFVNIAADTGMEFVESMKYFVSCLEDIVL